MGLALLLVYLKTKALRTGDEHYNRAARFWAKIFGINFALVVGGGGADGDRDGGDVPGAAADGEEFEGLAARLRISTTGGGGSGGSTVVHREEKRARSVPGICGVSHGDAD